MKLESHNRKYGILVCGLYGFGFPNLNCYLLECSSSKVHIIRYPNHYHVSQILNHESKKMYSHIMIPNNAWQEFGE